MPYQFFIFGYKDTGKTSLSTQLWQFLVYLSREEKDLKGFFTDVILNVSWGPTQTISYDKLILDINRRISILIYAAGGGMYSQVQEYRFDLLDLATKFSNSEDPIAIVFDPRIIYFDEIFRLYSEESEILPSYRAIFFNEVKKELQQIFGYLKERNALNRKIIFIMNKGDFLVDLNKGESEILEKTKRFIDRTLGDTYLRDIPPKNIAYVVTSALIGAIELHSLIEQGEFSKFKAGTLEESISLKDRIIETIKNSPKGYKDYLLEKLENRDVRRYIKNSLKTIMSILCPSEVKFREIELYDRFINWYVEKLQS